MAKSAKCKFISRTVWHEFLQQHTKIDGRLYCQECGKSDLEEQMTVHHRVPQSRRDQYIDSEGKSLVDELSNLLPLCNRCNSRINNKPDAFWSEKKYFDNHLNRDAFRVAQSEFTCGPINEYEYFWSKPISNINGKLFMICQVVGAGKTLSMFVLPFEINRTILAFHQNIKGVPRISKMLILTKDSQLCKQIANDILNDPLKYGFIDKPPRVKIIDSDTKLTDFATDDHDIAVMHPKMLWPNRDNKSDDHRDDDDSITITWHPMIDQFLNRYELICIDEAHYSHANVIELIRIARNSLVFGFTASPITADGSLLPHLVMCSSYGYWEAITNDGSMKQINLFDNPKPGTEEELLNTVTIVKTKDHVFLGDAPAEGDENRGKIVWSGPAATQTIIDATISKIHNDMDNGNLGKDTYYPEKLKRYQGAEDKEVRLAKNLFPQGGVENQPKYPYPAHAIIIAANKAEAEEIATHMNKIFDRYPNRYKRSEGYRAMAVYDGATTPFDQNHPFFYFKETGKLNHRACRFLVAVNMAAEGMNNPYVNTIAFARGSASLVSIVQRLGRGIRIVKIENSFYIEVQPKSHDTLYVLVHESEVETIAKIYEALQFILDPHENLKDVMNLDEYIATEDQTVNDDDDKVSAPYLKWRLWELAIAAGALKNKGKRYSFKYIEKRCKFIGKKNSRIRKAKALTEGWYYGAPKEMEELEAIFKREMPEPLAAILDSEERHLDDMDEQTALEWLESQKSSLPGENLYSSTLAGGVRAINQLRTLMFGKLGSEMQTTLNPEKTVEEYINELTAYLKWDFVDLLWEAIIHRFSVIRPGVDKSAFLTGGSLDKPSIAFQLRDTDFRQGIENWLRYETIKRDHCQEVQALFLYPFIKKGGRS